MNCIKNPRSLITAILTLALALLCFGMMAIQGAELRFVISGLFLLAWSGISLFSALYYKGPVQQTMELVDERDRLILEKTGHLTLRIVNGLAGAGCFISVVLYGLTKHPALLTVAVTLCGILGVMFLVTLLVNLYYERHL